MYVAVRSYSGQGASELFDVLGQSEEDVKTLISGVPGFLSYVAFRSGDGGAGHNAGHAPRNKGQVYPADPPTVDEIVAVMRQTPRLTGTGSGSGR